jgi:hypothetical protein
MTLDSAQVSLMHRASAQLNAQQPGDGGRRHPRRDR